jgi:predicted metal-dependent enzyme (double-stranded beta helix superfamily)
MAQETAAVTSIHDLAGRIRDASAPGSGPSPAQVRDILSEALTTPGDWIDPAYQHLGEGEYALYPVYRAEDGRCSMLVAVLRSGTPLPVHNHGSWAVVGVYKGREHETWFRRVDDGLSRDAPSWRSTRPSRMSAGPPAWFPTAGSTRSRRWTANRRCRSTSTAPTS